MQKKADKKTGFSLIELSIVILIVSILITGSLGISKTAINNSKVKVTKERMDTVYKAFSNYLAVNRRLPCPALLTVAKNTSGYGNEAATPGTCTSTYVSSTNAPNLVYGMVPITALNLDPDMAEDGFGSKFTYVVDKRFTLKSASIASSNGFEITKGVPNETDNGTTDLSGIDVQGPSGASLLSNKNGVLFLLSHGANKYNAFNASGTTQNGTSALADENNNSCNTCSTSGTTSFDREFLASSTDPNFDDIALFKTKTQLIRDADLRFIMCGLGEATIAGPISWTVNGAYGCSVCAGTANNSKICGPYGTWGANSTGLCTINTSICSVSSNAPDYDSGVATLSAFPINISFAHGLGLTPSNYSIELVCKSATSGYSIGDTIILPNFMDGDGARNLTIMANATNINIMGDAIYITNKSSITNVMAVAGANWNIRAKAWR